MLAGLSRCFKLLVCRGPECGEKRGSAAVYDELRRVLADRGVGASVELGWQSCFGRCTQGPNCLVREIIKAPGPQRFVFATMPAPRGGVSALYNGVTSADVADIVDQHVLGGRVVRRLIRKPLVDSVPVRSTENPE
jgi:(2Fe-2S) ferredoxin